ncbi:nucleotidyltransferase family protein [Nocardioides sp. R-C-SC26]|uniref:nucleotidyltransferase family protein n=1 Tax=Nocardioides sp. R-C-SC26 TaxID=2870414 RepID=UPI001E633AA0|nr:nucleotidyltransferase family protein [Nocardioides sp. R-C-SC26]
MREPHTPALLRKLTAVHDALTQAGIPHAIGGGIALAFHTAQPRFTNDIDVNVAAPSATPEVVLGAMPEGVVIHAAAADELRESDQVRLVWPDRGQRPEAGTPVDLFLPAHPTYHRLVTDRAEPVEIGGSRLLVISATDLVVFKSLFDRPKDWVDIAEMLAFGKVDVEEARRWLTEFLGPEDSRCARLDAAIEATSR